MNRLPTGMYEPGNSPVYHLDAGAKLIALLFLITAVVNTQSLAGYAVLAVFTFISVHLSGIGREAALSSVRRLRWFFLMIFLMNICFYGPEHPWFRLWILQPSFEGMMQGINVVARVFLILIFSNILTVTTSPLAMTDAIERLLSPLRVIGIPVGQIAMILSVAVQFIPTLFEETDMIRKAQTARGARFDSRKLLEKAKAVLPLMVPVFLAAFKRADELSLAMESRGYRTEVKTGSRKKVRFALRDHMAIAVCLLLCVIQIFLL